MFLVGSFAVVVFAAEASSTPTIASLPRRLHAAAPCAGPGVLLIVVKNSAETPKSLQVCHFLSVVEGPAGVEQNASSPDDAAVLFKAALLPLAPYEAVTPA